jgi:adenylyltransferase/sulfurtransferase
MNIVLIGYRGTGKTAVAGIVAAQLGMQVIRTDDLIVERERRSIPEIVERSGWDYFRDAESAVIAGLASRDNAVLDTGGGVVLRENNCAALKKNGLVFWLKASPAVIIERIRDDAGRPALTPGKSFTEEVADVLRQRQHSYHAAADIEIDTDGKTVEQVAGEILHYAGRLITPGSEALSAAERSRYLRQMLITGWGPEGQRKLRSATVFIAGAGGLGCPAALFLAAAGIGRIRLCDAGFVEPSNLNRQILYREADIGKEKVLCAATALRQLNPHTVIEPLHEKITDATVAQLTGTGHVILDCLDNFETRHVLNRYAVQKGLPLIHAGIEGLAGQITVIQSPETPCLSCFFPGTLPARKIFPVAGITPGIIGTLQAAEAIKLITGIGDTLKGRLLVWDGQTMEFQHVAMRRDPRCPVCGT